MEIEELVSGIWFGTIKSITQVNEAGWEFRKGKGISDLSEALKKAAHPKNGHAKIETELSMAELYVGDVLKKKREPVSS